MSSSVVCVAALLCLGLGISHAVDSLRLHSYWDEGACGPDGDDHNWGLCGWLTGGMMTNCPKRVVVSTNVCSSRNAKLVDQKKNHTDTNGCRYYGFAEFACDKNSLSLATKEATVIVGELPSPQSPQLSSENFTGQLQFRLIGTGKECSNVLKTLSNTVSSTDECAELVRADPDCGSKFEDRSHSKNPGRCSCMAAGATCSVRKDQKTNRYEISEIAAKPLLIAGAVELPQSSDIALVETHLEEPPAFSESSHECKESDALAQIDSEGLVRTKLIQGLMAERVKTKKLQQQLKVKQATVDDLSRRLRMDRDRTNFLRLRLERAEKDVQIKREVQVALQELMAIRGEHVFGVHPQAVGTSPVMHMEYVVHPKRTWSWFVLPFCALLGLFLLRLRACMRSQSPLALGDSMLEDLRAPRCLCNGAEKEPINATALSVFAGTALRYGFPSVVPYQLLSTRSNYRVDNQKVETILAALKCAAHALLVEASQEVKTPWVARFRFNCTHLKLHDHHVLLRQGLRGLRDDHAILKNAVRAVPARPRFVKDQLLIWADESQPLARHDTATTRSVYVQQGGVREFEKSFRQLPSVDTTTFAEDRVCDENLESQSDSTTFAEDEWECVGDTFADEFEFVGEDGELGVSCI